jgi:CRISPR-associated protein Cas1
VYDVIEKYRMWMDYVVVQLCRESAIEADLFTFDEDSGACRMEPLSKRILIQSVNDYLSEIIMLSGKERSRLSHIELEAQSLAQYFLKHA